MRETTSWPPPDMPRRGSPLMGVVVLAVLVTVVTLTYSAARGRTNPDGSPLAPVAPPSGSAAAAADTARDGPPFAAAARGDVGMRLLTADPPALLDLRDDSSTRIPDLPDEGRVYDVVDVAGTAVVVGTRACLDCVPSGEAYVVRDGQAVSLGPAWSVAPSLDGQGVWILRYIDKRRCGLREVGLDGQVRRPEHPIDCRARLRKETPAGLLVDIAASGYGPPDSALLDPETGEAIGRYSRIDAVTERFSLARIPASGQDPPEVSARSRAGGDAAAVGTSARFRLTELNGGTQHPLAWPSRLDRVVDTAVDSGGRYVAVEFVASSADAALPLVDVWVLDTVARRWSQLPDMPVRATARSTSMAWTPDGRLVLLGTFERVGDMVAVWGPGDERLIVSRTELPDERSSGSFTVLSPTLPDR